MRDEYRSASDGAKLQDLVGRAERKRPVHGRDCVSEMNLWRFCVQFQTRWNALRGNGGVAFNEGL